jgi:hypothetical protein
MRFIILLLVLTSCAKETILPAKAISLDAVQDTVYILKPRQPRGVVIDTLTRINPRHDRGTVIKDSFYILKPHR